jgi:Rod binding domain-containing protein
MGIREAAPALASLDALPARAPQIGKAATPAQVRKAAEDFEAVYVAQMLGPMFEGLSSEPPFGGGMAESFWRSLQLEEYAKAIVGNGGIGLADAVMRELLRAQEQATGG